VWRALQSFSLGLALLVGACSGRGALPSPSLPDLGSVRASSGTDAPVVDQRLPVPPQSRQVVLDDADCSTGPRSSAELRRALTSSRPLDESRSGGLVFRVRSHSVEYSPRTVRVDLWTEAGRRSVVPTGDTVLVTAMDSLPTGTFAVKVLAIGFNSYTDSLPVRAGFIDTVDVRLQVFCMR